MGQKVSAVHGVRSENYYEPGNAVNEVWVGDLEVISRLPFGDSDMAQAAWPEGDWPKIPWRPFLIPLKHQELETRSVETDVPDGTCRRALCPYLGGPFSHVSQQLSFSIWIIFFAIALSAFCLSIKIFDIPRRTFHSGRLSTEQEKGGFVRFCAIVTTGCHIFGSIVAVFDGYALWASLLCGQSDNVTSGTLLFILWAFAILLFSTLSASSSLMLWNTYADLRSPCTSARSLEEPGLGPGSNNAFVREAGRTPSDDPPRYELDKLPDQSGGQETQLPQGSSQGEHGIPNENHAAGEVPPPTPCRWATYQFRFSGPRITPNPRRSATER